MRLCDGQHIETELAFNAFKQFKYLPNLSVILILDSSFQQIS